MPETTLAAPALDALASATYTVDQLANLLQCSPRHVWRLIDGSHVPGIIRAGRLVRIHRATADDWLAAGCPSPRH